MNTMIGRLAASLRRHNDYRRTVAALKGLSPELARDLDIYPGLEREIALRAVYGR